MALNKQFLAETRRELEMWPDTSLTQENSGKHGRIVLHYKGESRIVIVANTPSDTRAIKNHMAIVRKELRGMGAVKTPTPASTNTREKNKPVRIDMPTTPAPVPPAPFEKLKGTTMTTIDAIFSSIEKLRYAEMLEFADIMSRAAQAESLRRSNVQDWARTIQTALDMQNADQTNS